MTSDPSNADVLDAVALELSRFSREVVAEVHRLRDELVIEQQRVTALEAEVADLQQTRTAPVLHDVPADPVAQSVVVPVDSTIPSSDDREAAEPATIEFAPLTLHAASDAVPTSAGLDNLARVLAELSEPIAVVWPTDT